MKNTRRIIIACLMALTVVPSFATGIEFNHDITFQAALDKAKKEGKLVFIDCYTSWCGPCKRLAAQVFTDSAVGAYFNSNYVNVKFDMEKEEGPSIATRYQVTAYPTLMWLDPNGSIKNKVVGGLDPVGLVNAGKKAADPIPDIMNAMDKKYAAGDRSQAFLEEYLKTYKIAGRDYETVFAEYMKDAAANNWTKESVQPTIFAMTNSINSAGLELLIKNKSAYIAKVGEKSYDDKINAIAEDALATAKRKTDPKMMEQAVGLVKSNRAPNSKQMAARMEMDYYFTTAHTPEYDKYVTDYIKKYGSNDAKMLNDVAWQYYINTDDTKYLTKAKDWAYKAVNIQNNCTNNTTYAYLQYKLENYSEATKACDYAIIKAKEESITPTSALALKEAIKKEAANRAKPQ